MTIAITSRRTFLFASGSVAALTFIPTLVSANNGWEETLDSLVGTSEPPQGAITLEMPEIAENGNVVPFDIFVDSPMSKDNYVAEIHVVTTGNPTPEVASYHLSPAMGVAQVSSRMRLGKTQEVYAVAKMSNGNVIGVKTDVKVTIGGCGG